MLWGLNGAKYENIQQVSWHSTTLNCLFFPQYFENLVEVEMAIQRISDEGMGVWLKFNHEDLWNYVKKPPLKTKTSESANKFVGKVKFGFGHLTLKSKELIGCVINNSWNK